MVAEGKNLQRIEPGLPTAPKAETAIGQVLSFFNIMDASTDRIIEHIPLMSDDDLVHVRGYARSLDRTSWRIEIAVDAEILSRAKLRGGRGHKDEEGEGRMAALERAADWARVHPDTIRRNAAIYQAFFDDPEQTIVDVHDTLTQKSYYEIALRADDPVAALRVFAEKKKADYKFSVRDARRWVAVGDVEEVRKRIIPSLIALTLEEPQRTVWEAWIVATNALRSTIPELRRDLNDCVKICREQLSRPEQTIEQRICSLLRSHPGSYSEDLARWLDLDAPKTDAVLSVMIAELTIREVPDFDKGARLCAAGGPVRMTYYFNYAPGTDPEEYRHLDPSGVDEFGDEI